MQQAMYSAPIIINILRTPLLRNVLLACLTIAIAFPIYIVFFAYPSFVKLLIKNTEDDAILTAMHLSAMFAPEDNELTRGLLSDDLINEIEKTRRHFQLEKIKIFSKSGEIIYSSNPKDVGKINRKEYFREIVAKGNVYTKLVRKGAKTLEDRVVTSDVVATYVPLMNDDRFIGILEIYYDITIKKEKLDNLATRSSVVLFAISSTLLIGIIIVLFRASKAIIDRNSAEEALQKAHDQLGQRVKERTAELSRTNEQLQLEIEERKRAEEELQRNYDTQTVVSSLLRFSLEDISFEKLLKHALDLILSIPWLTLESTGSIYFVEDDSEVLALKAQKNLPESLPCRKVPFGKCFCGKAAMTQEIQYANCLDDRHEITYEGITPHGHCCVPILSSGKTLGVINLYIEEGHCYYQKEEQFLTTIADTLVGIILRKHSQMALQHSLEALRNAIRGSIQLIATTVEVRDPYTAGHQQRVADLARAIATEMGLSKDQIDAIRMAGVIHDLGKISVPTEILCKPSKLTDIEFSLIKTHPQVGYNILKNIEFPWPIAQIVYQHHEKMDGSGYPLGLSGEDILMEARIMAVADVVEAMASHRPYRPGLGIDTALEEISKNKGKLYDPNVVDVCLKLFREGEFEFK